MLLCHHYFVFIDVTFQENEPSLSQLQGGNNIPAEIFFFDSSIPLLPTDVSLEPQEFATGSQDLVPSTCTTDRAKTKTSLPK